MRFIIFKGSNNTDKLYEKYYIKDKIYMHARYRYIPFRIVVFSCIFDDIL